LAEVAIATAAAVFGVLSAMAQTKVAPTPPTFEVASIRPSDPNDKRSAAIPRTWGDETGKVSLHQISLDYLLLHVYNLEPDQLSGPIWLPDKLFDILATVPAGAPKEQIPLMFQSLMEERFGLKFHRETHTEKVLALVVGKGGPKLKEPLPDDTEAPIDRPIRTGAVGAENRSVTIYMKTVFATTAKWTMANGVNHVEYLSMTMENLAKLFNQGNPPTLGLPVVDMTGLKGSFLVVLDFAGTLGASVATSDGASDPTGSVQESLHKMGLDLVRRESQTEKFVIDHIEKTPTPN
jgi:uncharacterized protein (TIGR03435 family)